MNNLVKAINKLFTMKSLRRKLNNVKNLYNGGKARTARNKQTCGAKRHEKDKNR
jgi:hypothetical protein